MIGSPPTAGDRNAVMPWRSRSRMNNPPARTGVASRTRPCVTRIDQTNKERFLNVMPGARCRRIVTRKLMAPAVEEIPSSCNPTIHMSTPELESYTLSGVYPVHPMFAAPSHMMTPATGMIQKLSALIRGKAISFAPIRGGDLRVPEPARIGVQAKKNIVVPGIVDKSVYVFASTIVGPRDAGSGGRSGG